LKDGWIKLHRRMLDSDIWKATKRKPFDKRSAWIDLLLRANHKKVTISIGNTLISLEPGQVFTSEVNKIYLGDCLELMKEIARRRISAIPATLF